MKILVNLDLNKNQLLNAVIQNLTGDPGSPAEGQIYADTATHLLKVHNGTEFRVAGYLTKTSGGTNPGAILAGGSASVGSSNDAARADHVHALGASTSPTAETVGATAVIGTSNDVARADHVHAMPGTATTGASGFMSSADKTKLDNATATNTGSTLVLRDSNARFQAADPSAAQDVATKNYVDNLSQGLDAKQSVTAATTGANITLSGGAPNTLDSVSLSVNDRILVKDQSTTNQNGIYIVQTLGSGSDGTWVRASDANTWSELISAYVWVEEGTANQDSGWLCTVNDGGTIDSTAVAWVQFSGAGQITAGAGLAKTGNTINVGTASTSRIVVNTDDIDLATVTQGTGSNFVKISIDTYGRVTGTTTVAAGDIPSLSGTYLALAGGTMTGAVTLRAGSTGVGTAPAYFQSGSLLAAAVNGALEYNGTDLYFTQAGTQRVVALEAVSKLSDFASTTSAELAGVISDETGYTSGAELVFNISPTIDTSIVSGTSSFALVDTTATTVNFAGEATTLNIGHDGTTASTTGIATGATASGTKTLNLGTGASAGTTNVNIGATNAGTTTINSPNLTIGNAATVAIQTTAATATTINFMTGLSNASAKTFNIGTSSSNGALSLVLGGSLTFAGHQTAGFVKTNASGVVSIDPSTYLTSLSGQSQDFGVVQIDNTDTEYTWVATDATTTTADTTQDTLKVVAAKTGTSNAYGIEVLIDATNDALGIRHKDTSTQANVDNSGNGDFIKSMQFDEFGHVTSVTSGTPAGSVSKYAVDVGNNSDTSIVVTHSLGTRDVVVALYDNSSPYERMYPDIRHTSTTQCTLIFAVAPTTNQYRCVVTG